jgi:tripartite-type tricarboxylate transporter receptor subunit TctC
MKFISKIRTLVTIGVAMTVAMAMTSHTANAQSLEDMYKGKTITIMLGHPPGGSYDLYSQLAAEFMGKHIPGNPDIIVQHRPGGGGRKGASFFINKTEPDGMTFGVFPDSLGQIQFTRPKAAKWDAKKFRYIGRFSTANVGFAVRTDKAGTIDEMRSKELVVACTSKSARAAQQAAALHNMAGFNFKLVCGYKGSQATVMASLRGEADLYSQNYASFVSDPADLGDGAMKILLQTGLERDAGMPDIPLMQELTDDPKGKAVLTFLGSSAPIGRSMMIHPNTPEYIVKGIREAFQKMLKDKAFLAEAKKRSAIITPGTGEELEAILAEQMDASDELIAAVRAAIDTSGAKSVKK